MAFGDRLKKAFKSSKNFKYLDELIHSGVKEIVLDSNIVLGNDEESQYVDGMKLDVDDLLIDGGGHKIDARGKTRIFCCSGKNIKIKNIILKNGFSERRGGAINIDGGELIIIDSKINDNSAWAGSAINASGSDLTIIESTFTNNTTRSNDGAIHVISGFTHLEDLNFNNNISESSPDIVNQGNLFIKGKLSSNQSEIIVNKVNISLLSDIMDKIKNYGEITELKLLDNDQKDFNYLNELVHSGSNEIKLEHNILLNLSDNEEKKFKNGIRIDRNDLIIDGNGHEIDAQGLTRIFECSGKNIKIKNFILKNGFTTELGGAVYNSGELTIMGSTFSENEARGPGGAVYNSSGELTIIGSTFSENEGWNGGVIYNDDGDLDIGESAFSENEGLDGGVIYNDGGELRITDSILNKNEAKSYGAIYNNGVLAISKSTLSDNVAHVGGSAYNDGGEFSIVSSTFNKNVAGCDGGAISNINDGKLSIEKSVFEYNNASSITSDGGGAIYNDAELSIMESSLKGNTAEKYGGAICNNGRLSIKKSTFNGNSSRISYGGGGAIYNRGELDISSSILNENMANPNGGIINNSDGGGLTIRDSTISKNTAVECNVIIFNNVGNLKIFNCEISENMSENNVILNNDALQVHNTNFICNKSKNIILNQGDESNLGIINGKFMENDVDESVVYNEGKFCSIDKTIFENNMADKNIVNKSELTLINPKMEDGEETILNEGNVIIKKSSSDFKNKISWESSVEIYEDMIPSGKNFDFGYLDRKIRESSENKIILDEDICLEKYEKDYYEGGIELDSDDLVIDGNGHTIDGDGMSRIFIVTGKNITLKNIIFKNGLSHRNYDNFLNNNGGAIKINHINLTIKNCEFANNKSEDNGGAVNNDGGEVNIVESIFNENTAKEGGALNNIGGGEMHVVDSIFAVNSAKEGGAINNEASLIITGSTLNENTVDYGGAINNAAGGVMCIIESMLEGNHAKEGGALCNNGELTITESALSGNTADKGGAISNYDGKLSIRKSTLNKNLSGEYGEGGALHNSSDDGVEIIESVFERNSAKKGGAIFNKGECELNIASSTFRENNAREGGTIYKRSGLFNIGESTFESNVARWGGVIYNWGGELSVLSSIFISNETLGGGPIINTDGIPYELENCEFINNSSDGKSAKNKYINIMKL